MSELSNNTCKICSYETTRIFNAQILGKYAVDYFRCPKCAFAQTEKPYWLAEAYESPINDTDTGIMIRNQRFSKVATGIIVLFFNRKEKFLDYAGGYGVFTRIMRDIGFDYYWDDPYTKNLMAKGFEKERGVKYHLATTFESFEHFADPMAEIKKITAICDNILFSTERMPNPMPDPKTWWYYGLEHGQHIAFYSVTTFKYIAEQLGMHYYNLDNVHILSKKKIGVLGRLFFSFKYAKHLTYVFGALFSVFFKSKTMEDMYHLRKN